MYEIRIHVLHTNISYKQHTEYLIIFNEIIMNVTGKIGNFAWNANWTK